jgi:1,4-dihydroxy-2-naphthoyl-CoA hydrolase
MSGANDSLRWVTEPSPAFLPVERTMPGVLGFELLDWSDEIAHGRFEVSDRVRQPYGIVHGGAYAAMAETLASVATAMAVLDDGMIAMGQSNNTSFLRPVSAGTVHAEARRRHRGRGTWVWDVDFRDEEGRLCATSRVTMAVRAAPTSPGP